jgi:hypothetical protein
MESTFKPLTLDEFKKALGDNYAKWKGKFDKSLFDDLLNKLKFAHDKIDRQNLRIELEDEGFFEPTQAKGNYFYF